MYGYGFMRQFTDPIKYGHATGRVKVRETRLLAAHQMERLIEADTLAEQIRVLDETDYGEFFEGVGTTEQVEEALQRYLHQVYLFMNEVSSDEHIHSYFKFKHDFQNLKTLLKEKYLGKKLDHVYSELGFLDARRVELLIKEERLGELPEPYKGAAEEAVSRFEESQDAQEIDIVLDKRLYHELYKVAYALRSKYLIRLVRTATDLNNLKIFLRAKNLGRPKEFLKKALSGNGFIRVGVLVGVYPEIEDLINEVKNRAYVKLVEKLPVFKVGEEAKVDLALFDKQADNFLLEMTKKAKLIAIGPEPLIGYITAKENEVLILRLILMGKINNLPKIEIKEKIREPYG